MTNELINEHVVNASLLDTKSKLGLVGSVICMQDNMCEFFEKNGADGLTMLPICNAFFVITKTLIKFNEYASWLDKIKIKTNVAKKSNIRVTLSNNIYLNDKVIVCGIQEMCAVDGDSRKLRTVHSTLFPKDICESGLENNELAFTKFAEELTDEDFVKTIKVDLSHLDFYKHTNNVECVKFCLSTLPLDIYENNEIDTFEIHYINQTVLGDEINIFRKMNDKKVYFELKLTDGTVVTKSMITIK
ncbi:MAG: hypothetical protein E7345_02650 [Clostridiales bacterium]|nr:hypothetical protein [Clostridiales bacterium]